MKKTAFLLIVLAELVIVSLLASKGFKERLVYNTDSKLAYFYRFPNSFRIQYHPSWQKDAVEYEGNGEGLNERYNYSFAKPKSTYRIVALGDSLTFGQYVATKDNWVERLEDKLNANPACKKYDKVEVINLGMPDYDITYSVELYRLEGAKFNPDLVIWMLEDPMKINELLLPMVRECSNKNPNCWREAENKIKVRYGDENIQSNQAISFDKVFDFYKSNVVVVNLDHTEDDILKIEKHPEKVKVLNLNFFKKTGLQFPGGYPNIKGHEYFSDNIYNYLINNRLISCE